jgi:hypothetical protein
VVAAVAVVRSVSVAGVAGLVLATVAGAAAVVDAATALLVFAGLADVDAAGVRLTVAVAVGDGEAGEDAQRQDDGGECRHQELLHCSFPFFARDVRASALSNSSEAVRG